MQNHLSIYYILFGVVVIMSLWFVFKKANHKGWAAIIPFYNLYIIQKIIKKPWWWILIMFIPWVGILWVIWSTNLLVKSFRKPWWFTLGLIFFPFIFYPILAFDDSKYREPDYGDKDYILIPELY